MLPLSRLERENLNTIKMILIKLHGKDIGLPSELFLKNIFASITLSETVGEKGMVCYWSIYLNDTEKNCDGGLLTIPFSEAFELLVNNDIRLLEMIWVGFPTYLCRLSLKSW